MGSLIAIKDNLPSNLTDLKKITDIGREQLVSIRAELRAMNKVGVAGEFHEQKLEQAQNIAEVVLDAEVRIGELMKEVPKASGGDRRSENFKIDSSVDFEKPKSEVITDAGFTQKQVERFQIIASYPEFVEQAKAEARENDEIVTRSDVLRLIEKEKNKPHVANNSGNNEWYTPAEYITLTKKVIGEIDLDPASCETANNVVKAKQYYTAENDGLKKDWQGKVWMNPPYSAELIGQFADKFVKEFKEGKITEGIVLVNNATETGWFSTFISCASAVCFPVGRVHFYGPDGETGAPLQGQAVIYFGDKSELFKKTFAAKGWCAQVHAVHE